MGIPIADTTSFIYMSSFCSFAHLCFLHNLYLQYQYVSSAGLEKYSEILAAGLTKARKNSTFNEILQLCHNMTLSAPLSRFVEPIMNSSIVSSAMKIIQVRQMQCAAVLYCQFLNSLYFFRDSQAPSKTS